jgi:hypothetical protein
MTDDKRLEITVNMLKELRGRLYKNLRDAGSLEIVRECLSKIDPTNEGKYYALYNKIYCSEGEPLATFHYPTGHDPAIMAIMEEVNEMARECAEFLNAKYSSGASQ